MPANLSDNKRVELLNRVKLLNRIYIIYLYCVFWLPLSLYGWITVDISMQNNFIIFIDGISLITTLLNLYIFVTAVFIILETLLVKCRAYYSNAEPPLHDDNPQLRDDTPQLHDNNPRDDNPQLHDNNPRDNNQPDDNPQLHGEENTFPKNLYNYVYNYRKFYIICFLIVVWCPLSMYAYYVSKHYFKDSSKGDRGVYLALCLLNTAVFINLFFDFVAFFLIKFIHLLIIFYDKFLEWYNRDRLLVEEVNPLHKQRNPLEEV